MESEKKMAIDEDKFTPANGEIRFDGKLRYMEDWDRLKIENLTPTGLAQVLALILERLGCGVFQHKYGGDIELLPDGLTIPK